MLPMKETSPPQAFAVKAFAFLRSFFVVAGWSGVSRVSGVVREILFVNIFGASIFSDVYSIAMKLPSFFRRFFAEGALNAVLVPRFSNLLIEKQHSEVQEFAQRMFTILTIGLAAFVALMIIAMPYLIHIIAPGFKCGSYVYENVVHFARWTSPYILLISLVAVMSGFLNSMHRFAWPAAISIVANGAMISALIIGKQIEPRIGARGVMHVVCISVLLGGVVQCWILKQQCLRRGLRLRWVKPRFTPAIQDLFRASVPGMIGGGVMQVNIFVDIAFGSQLPTGSVSFLSYADRLNQLPISLLGAAIGTTLLPALSRYWNQNEIGRAHETQNRAILFGFFLVIPAAIGLFILAHPLVNFLYGHGKFDCYDVQQTKLALQAFCCGLPAYVFMKVASSIFFSHKDTTTPLYIACVCVSLNCLLNYILMHHLLHVGIALATAISACINAGLSFGILVRRRWLYLHAAEGCIALQILCAGACMGFVVWLVSQRVNAYSSASVLISIAVGLAVYAAMALLLRLPNKLFTKTKP